MLGVLFSPSQVQPALESDEAGTATAVVRPEFLSCLENAAMQQRRSVLESLRFVLQKSTSTSYECVAGLRLGMGGNSEPAVVSLQLINMDLGVKCRRGL
jgi:hypothetical protein